MRALARICVTAAVVAASFASLGVAAAQATLFKTEAAPATISGESVAQGKFVLEGGTFECAEAFSGTMNAVSAGSLTLGPSYAGCVNAATGTKAAVTVNGCTYTIELDASTPTGDVDIVCPAGKAINIDWGICHIAIGSQAGLSQLEFANNLKSGSERDFDFTGKVEGIAYTQSQFCAGGGGAKGGGKYEVGGVTVTSANGGAQQGIWVE